MQLNTGIQCTYSVAATVSSKLWHYDTLELEITSDPLQYVSTL